MKFLTPILLALFGLAAGVGAGVATRPEPAAEPAEVACNAPGPAEAGEDATPVPCPAPAADFFAPAEAPAKKPAAELAYVTMDKPFVVPVFSGEKVAAMVVVSLSVETELEAAPAVEGVKPRLRDSFLAAMFRHANSGGFDGSYTGGRKMDDLKSALLAAAREVLPDTPVEEILVTEIARQDV